MAISIRDFYGGGHDAGTLQSATNIQVPQGCGRVIVVRGEDENNTVLQLPFKFIPTIRRLGWPAFLIINEGSQGARIANFGETIARYTIPANRCVHVGLDADSNWRFSEPLTYSTN